MRIMFSSARPLGELIEYILNDDQEQDDYRTDQEHSLGILKIISSPKSAQNIKGNSGHIHAIFIITF